MVEMVLQSSLYLVYGAGIFACLMALFGKVEWALTLVVVLFPLRNVIDKLQVLPGGRSFVNILFIFIIVGWVVNALSRREAMFKPSGMNVVLFLFGLYICFSFVRGYGYLASVSQFQLDDTRLQLVKNFLMLPLLFFMVFNNVRDEKMVWQVVLIICATMVVMDYYTVRQILWFNNIESRVKINSTFSYLGPNEIAAFYNQYTILLCSLLFALRHKLLKLILIGIIAANIFCVLFLYSRAAYIALVAGLGFLFLFKKRWLLIPLVLLCLFWQSFLPAKVQDRINMTTNEYGELDKSNMGRITVWNESLEIFRQNPVVGAGFGVFGYLGFELRDTHNIYLKVLAEQGVIGMFIFLLVLGTMFWQGIKLFDKGRDDISKCLGIGFAACMVTLIFNNMFGDRWTYTEVSSTLWVFLALVCRLNYLSVNKNIKPKTQKLYNA
ncbi:MAG: O-antigen ligase family protein [Candidatus Omnitrophica bacterium]|nr:O-antigen ligase family protein [Candidatus Omnitrophota bacterium]